MPLIAMHYFGRGLVLFCASDETWRWRWNEENESRQILQPLLGYRSFIKSVCRERRGAGRNWG